MECSALAGSWCPLASAQLSVSPAAPQAVEAAGAGLAPQRPPGLLDPVVWHQGQRALAAGARAGPAHAEGAQGGGAGGAGAGAGPCGGAGQPVPQGGHAGQDPELPAEEGQAEEEPAAPALPEAENLHHPRAEHQEDPEAGAAGLHPGPGGELHLEAGHAGQVPAAPGPDGQPAPAAAVARAPVAARRPRPGGALRRPAHRPAPEPAPPAGALPGLHLLPRGPPAPGAQVRRGARSADQNRPVSFRGRWGHRQGARVAVKSSRCRRSVCGRLVRSPPWSGSEVWPRSDVVKGDFLLAVHMVGVRRDALGHSFRESDVLAETMTENSARRTLVHQA